MADDDGLMEFLVAMCREDPGAAAREILYLEKRLHLVMGHFLADAMALLYEARPEVDRSQWLARLAELEWRIVKEADRLKAERAESAEEQRQ